MTFLPFDPKVIEYNFVIAIGPHMKSLIFNDFEKDWGAPSVLMASYSNEALTDTLSTYKPRMIMPLKRNA